MRFTAWKTVLACVVFLAATAGAADKIQALIITGDDVGPHPWKETSAATTEILTKSGKFDVKVVEGFDVLKDKAELAKYDEIIFMIFNAKKVAVTDEQKQNLYAYVKDGKGFVVTHLCSATFGTDPEWAKLCGRYWVFGKSGHGKRVPFQCKVADKADPITKGIEPFEADDELYAKLLGEDKIHVLIEADSDFSKKTEPLMFTLEYGKGRVFHNAFGHDGKALKNPALEKLMVRGYEWAAKGKVSD
ncbi:MAG TPA: ThuA domain-containing protein [Planctomycetota bacterium]|jgi:type 1 glutamine amidotransferase